MNPEEIKAIAESNAASFEDQFPLQEQSKEDYWHTYYENTMDTVRENGGSYEDAVDAVHQYMDLVSWAPELYREETSR